MRESGLATNEVASRHCLNCGAGIDAHFCGACGQRAVPADPNIRELVGDAWQELSGYDGRIAATFRNLLHPGRLTIDYLAGRRARYLSPVRLYLTASVIYFLVAAAAPVQGGRTASEVRGPGSLRIGLTNNKGGAVLTDEDRAAIEAQIEQAPWPISSLLLSVSRDPDGFRQRLFTIMPRVFFAMLPVFAAIVWMFYRERRFPAALVFAVHLNAFAFLAFALSEAAKFVPSTAVNLAVGVIVLLGFSTYLMEFGSMPSVFSPLTTSSSTE